jgi:hypothetical protein
VKSQSTLERRLRGQLGWNYEFTLQALKNPELFTRDRFCIELITTSLRDSELDFSNSRSFLTRLHGLFPGLPGLVSMTGRF